MDQVKIGKFIQELRKEKNITQSELAERLGVTDRSVSNWENGKNMPDVSLYKLLCNELEISVNELISGERIEEEKYKEKSDKNIIMTISKIEKSKKQRKKILIVLSLLFLVIISYIAYCNILFIETNIKYDNRIMECHYDSDNSTFNYVIHGTSVANIYDVERELENENIIFIKAKLTIGNRRYYHWENYQEMAELTSENKHIFGITSTYENNDGKTTKIYYTEAKIDRIKKANEKELKEIIEKSHLMCSN